MWHGYTGPSGHHATTTRQRPHVTLASITGTPDTAAKKRTAHNTHVYHTGTGTYHGSRRVAVVADVVATAAAAAASSTLGRGVSHAVHAAPPSFTVVHAAQVHGPGGGACSPRSPRATSHRPQLALQLGFTAEQARQLHVGALPEHAVHVAATPSLVCEHAGQSHFRKLQGVYCTQDNGVCG